MRKAAGGIGLCAAMLLAGTAMATRPTGPATQQTAPPFPPGQTSPHYQTGANNVGASLQHPGSGPPNAGATGVWPGSRDSPAGLGHNGASPHTR